MELMDIISIVGVALTFIILIVVIVLTAKVCGKMNEVIKLMNDQAERMDSLAEAKAEESAPAEPEGEIVKAQGLDSEEVVVIPRVVLEPIVVEDVPAEEGAEEVKEEIVEVPVEEPAPAEEVVEEPVEEPVIEEPVEEPAIEEPVEEPTPVVEDVIVLDETAATETVEVGEMDNPFGDIKKIPFAEKLLSADEQTQIFYDTLNNEFNSYRKLHIRISAKCVSYRLGRDLVAKITYRGKTMKLHLALDVNAYPENIYFQKDESDVKAYEEVPFTVKVKSERGLNRAIALIEALAAEKAMEKKAHWNAIDSIADLKEWQK